MLVVMLLSGPASFIANKAVSQGVGTVTDHLTAGQGVVDRIVKDASDTNVAIKAVDLDQVCDNGSVFINAHSTPILVHVFDG